MKYKIVGIEVPKESIVDVPDNIMPLNCFYSPTSGKLMIAFLEPIVEEVEKEVEKESEGKASIEDEGSGD